MSAPTRTQGFVDPYALGNDTWASIYLDLLEHVPDLVFPDSVHVYARMRRDPQLSAIQQGWFLQLRRCQWQLDPAGCRPEVVEHVADGMGLPVAGKDKPGPARLRGVSWNDHLAASLRHLTFGFAGFEMQADASGPLAQLAGLWERPQWTISHIHSDPKTGLLTGITQDAAWKRKSPQITADRLVWYVNDREGANWAGTSLLRPAYASWLIKEEMRRVHAISNKRWGAGVPVMEALPGTNPTSGQMTEAMQMAAAAQAGMQAGAASPPGFVLRLMGLTGSVPDTLSFLKWLDQQMSRSALMGFLDLGETANGSRALGETFVDSLLLALEACAEAVADIATRQVAARIVDWNWGEDEPVPRVVASGVGSRREVTAESLNLLMTSGALDADPALKAWIRREYRLPEQEGTAPPKVAVPGVDLPKQAGVSRPRPRARRTAQGQMALFDTAGDKPEPDIEAIQEQWETARATLLAQWPDAAGPMVNELTAQAQTAIEADDLGLLGDLAVSAAVLSAVALLIGDAGTGLAVTAAANVVAEAAAQGVTVEAPDEPGAARIRQTAEAVAAVIAAGYSSGAARAALQVAGGDPQVVANAVRVHLDSLGTSKAGLVGDNVSAVLSAAQNAGRLAVLEAAPTARYRAVETLDVNTCAACRDADGTVYDTLADAVAVYPLVGNADCLGRLRCRGFIAPDWT